MSYGDIHIRNSRGRNSMMEASKDGYYYIVESLLKKGVDKFVRDNYGDTALDLARKGGHSNIVRLLEGWTGLSNSDTGMLGV